jgi:hypothetical protein
MDRSPERGVLLDDSGEILRGIPLGKLLGISPLSLRLPLEALEKHRVLSYREDGAIYCRKMVRDTQKRQQNRENGAKGGNPKLVKSDNPPDKLEVKARYRVDIEEKREEKKGIDSKSPALPVDPLAEFPALSDFIPRLYELIISVHPTVSIPAAGTPKWNADRKTLGQIIRLDEVKEADLIEALEWLYAEENDRFLWSEQMESIAGYRKKKASDGLNKIQKAMAHWRKVGPKSAGDDEEDAKEERRYQAELDRITMLLGEPE